MSYLSLAVTLLTGLALAPVLLHGLGVASFGLYSVLQAAAGYLGVLEAGVSTATVQRVARLQAAGDETQLRVVLATARSFFLAASLATTLLVLVATPFVGVLLRLGPLSVRPAQLALVLLAVTTVAGFASSVGSAILYGGGRGDRLSEIGLLSSTILRLGQISVALAGGGLVGIVAVSAGLAVGSTIVTLRVAHRSFPCLRSPLRNASRAALVDLLRSGRRNATVAVSGTLSYGLDTVILGVILPVAQVAPYSLALRACNLLQAIATRGTASLMPSLAHFHATGNLGLTYRLYRGMLLVSLAIFAPLAVALTAFGPPLLHLWLGSVPTRTYELVVAMLVLYLLHLPGHQSFVLLTAIDHNKTLARISLVAAVANLGLSILATYRYGAVGPVLGSLAEAAAVDVFLLPVLVARTLQVRAREMLVAVALPAAAILCVAAALALGVRWALEGLPSFWALPGAALTAAASWFVAAPLLRRAHPDLADTFKWLQVRILPRSALSRFRIAKEPK